MAVLFGLTILPMVLVIGGAVDFAGVQGDRSRLSDAADAAIMAAVSKDALGLEANAVKMLTERVFLAQLKSRVAGTLTVKQATVTDTDGTRTINLTYSARVPTSFIKMIGLDSITVSGSAASSTSMPIYMDFYVLLDNSPSMGVAATSAGINMMVANTSDGCAFACHNLQQNGNDYYALAKRLGVATRIDVMRTATQRLMDTAATVRQTATQFRMAIYTFGGAGTSRGLTTISSLTSDLAGAKAAAGAIDLMTVPYFGHDNDQYTEYDKVFPALNRAIGSPGTGSSPSVTPQKVVFFVSDGVADIYKPQNCGGWTSDTGRCQEPIDLANCTALKNRGIKVAALYTTYLPLPTNGWYMNTVAPWSPRISANMKACASPGFYFEVSPTGGITEAMDAMFRRAIQTARLVR